MNSTSIVNEMAKKQQKQLTKPKQSKLELTVEELTPTYLVEHKDFDGIVRKVYKQPFSFINDKKCSRESHYISDMYLLFRHITAGKDEEDSSIADAIYEDIKSFKERGFSKSSLALILLYDLCANGHIKPGNYIVRVSW